MTLNTITPTIKIYEALSTPAITTNARLVCVVGSLERALSGARSLTIASGKSHFIEIQSSARIKIEWVFAKDVMPRGAAASPAAVNPMVAAADNFIANRRAHQAIATGHNDQISTSWFSKLKSRTPQPGYLVYTTDDETASIEALNHWRGARRRRNGANHWLILIPMEVVHGSQPATVASAA